MTVARQPTPAQQVKGLRVVARAMVMSGVLIGVGIPALFSIMKIDVVPTSSGFDLIWLVFAGLMIMDFVLAWWFARRASAIEQSMPPA